MPFPCYVKNPANKPYRAGDQVLGDSIVQCAGNVLRHEAHSCVYRYAASNGSGPVDGAFCAQHDFLGPVKDATFTAVHTCGYTTHSYGWKTRGYFITTWYNGETHTSAVAISSAISSKCF